RFAGRPTANLAAFLIETGVNQIKERGDFSSKKSSLQEEKNKERSE
ncbi:MAG: hypothetical protein HC917_15800, partial [Richelia sp. SM2_1_7]|nr:hypothetical protein [Richelia sp. SM2_1_7]